ncbi:hypothetical protein DFR58_11968 [Anaerobacterium chartisolvens]|uniref:Uncharacterized protein n=1 Tax=Anaerobacterium chartisolvens TaxID=1297424 RepID=A0A369AUY1_9FIRM|nr:hypothetical protein [Anaerobacterium chartisolvens]RCX13011.1 hypothetical protein DFR58_11968 [Anaerobacterium chartisolvens]
MGESLSKIIALFLSVLLLFIFPILNMFENQDDTTKVFVLNETAKFVDSVRNLGYITPDMYREFTRRLSATNNIYSIQMEHYHKRYDPLDSAGASENKFNINYRGTYTESIMSELFPASSAADPRYKLGKGDYFAVRVRNENKTLATKIQQMLYGADMAEAKIIINYGGMVKDEDY